MIKYIDMHVEQNNSRRFEVYGLTVNFTCELVATCRTWQEARFVCNEHGFILD